MAELMQEYWIAVLAIAIVLLAIAIWFVLANRKTKVNFGDSDGSPARRNQSLIDSPAVAPFAPTRAVTKPAEPAVQPVKAPTPAAAGSSDDLCRIKGVGPKLKSQLNEMGVTTFSQIAGWDEAEIDRIDAQLGRFQGRIRRDDWRGQAAFLAAGDIAGYENQFGKL